MIFRAIALSLALLIGIGVIIPLATDYTKASSRAHKKNKRKHRKYKKFSKKWWRAYHARIRKEKVLEARKRRMRLHRIRLAANPVSAPATGQNTANTPPANQFEELFKLVEGRVKNVYSGDTVKVEAQDGKVFQIRMLGISAPEAGQDFGGESQKRLGDLILGKNVTVIIRKRDSSDRYIGTVYFGGKDVNLGQIETGMARYFQEKGYEPTEDDRRIYKQAEEKSRIERSGLWARQKFNAALGVESR